MNINCQTDLISGATTCDFPYLQTYIADNNESYYVSSLWSGSDLLISFFLFIIILIMIGKIIFDFFFSPVVKLKKKYD